MDSRGRSRPSSQSTTTVTPTTPVKATGGAQAAPPRRTSTQPHLTAKEEQVLRMRYGIKAPPNMKLEFEGQDFDETRKRIAEIEHMALQMILQKRTAEAQNSGRPTPPATRAAAPAGAPSPAAKPSTKEKIINKLRDM